MNNNKRSYKPLLTGAVVAIIILCGIYFNFKHTVPESFLKNGGFKRIENHIAVTLNQKFKLKNDVYEFIGYYKKSILLRGTNQNTIFAYSDDVPLTNSLFFDLNKEIPGINDILSVEVDTAKGELHVFAPNRQELLVFDLSTKLKKRIIKLPQNISRGTMTNNIVTLVQDSESGTNSVLAVYSVDSNGKLGLIKTSAAIFKSKYSMQDDGLIKPGLAGTMAYMNFLINKFYIVDTALNTLVAGKTIDTVTTPPKISITGGGSIRSYAEPVRVVNDNFRTIGRTLLIRSLIATDNSEITTIRENAVIDAYDIQHKGKYLFSYFLSGLDGQSPADFYMTANKLFLVYPDNLLIYTYKNN